MSVLKHQINAVQFIHFFTESKIQKALRCHTAVTAGVFGDVGGPRQSFKFFGKSLSVTSAPACLWETAQKC